MGGANRAPKMGHMHTISQAMCCPPSGRRALAGAAAVQVVMGLLLSCLLKSAGATLLAASQIEACVDTGSNNVLSTCRNRMLLTLSVQNGQNGTESVSAYTMGRADDGTGQFYDMVDEVSIYLSKSRIALQYPLVYQRSYNNQPYEIVLTKDAGGRSFNWLTNPCIDDPNQNGACGWVIDAAGNHVPYSNGFCCQCNVADYLSGSSSGSRANLACELFSSANSQSAHCIRMSPLWYSAFTIGSAEVKYTIDVILHRCRSVNGTRACVYDMTTIGPAVPGACVQFSALHGDTAKPSNATSCDAWVSLEGDFAAFQDSPSFDSKLLMIPAVCNSFALCGNRTIESPERWMLVDKTLTTMGSDCDKVGTSYAAFQMQGSRCNTLVSSCVRHQLQDFYAADLAAEARGGAGSYFIKYFKMGGTFDATIQNPATARMVFGTSRYQKTVVTMMVDADRVRYVLHVSPAKIISAVAPSFEAMSKSGHMTVRVANIGDVQSSYTVAAQCSTGIIALEAIQLTLAPPPAFASTADVTFLIYTEQTDAQVYFCVVQLSNALFQVVDRQAVQINTTAMVQTTGEQNGTPAPGAPMSSNGGETGATPSCSDCSAWNLLCSFKNRCFGAISGWMVGLLGSLGLALLVVKYPWLILSTLRTLMRCGCSSWGSGGGAATQQQHRQGNGAPSRTNVGSGGRRPRTESVIMLEVERRIMERLKIASLAATAPPVVMVTHPNDHTSAIDHEALFIGKRARENPLFRPREC